MDVGDALVAPLLLSHPSSFEIANCGRSQLRIPSCFNSVCRFLVSTCLLHFNNKMRVMNEMFKCQHWKHSFFAVFTIYNLSVFWISINIWMSYIKIIHACIIICIHWLIHCIWSIAEQFWRDIIIWKCIYLILIIIWLSYILLVLKI